MKFAKLPPAAQETILDTAQAAERRVLTDSRAAAVDIVAKMRQWKAEPWTFVREVLRGTPDRWQDRILHAVVGLTPEGTPLPPEQPHDKIALKACKGPGKTCLEAWLAWWFLDCFESPNILATSITGENLRDNLWKEMAVWQQRSKLLTEMFTWQTTRIFLKTSPETWWMSARTWPKDADKTSQADTLAGLHARNTMLILDESGDIPESVLATGLAHHSTVDLGDGEQTHLTLQCGNPTSLDGSLGVACTRDRKFWYVHEITGDPNDPERAPRMSVAWCNEQIETFGREHPWVLVNVFGKFPPTQDNKLLGPEVVRAAMRLSIDERVWHREQRVAGLDVARSLNSDRSSLCRRQGPVVFPFKVWRLDDAEVLTGQVSYELGRFRPAAVFVDATGIGGPVADRLRALGFNVIMVYFGNPARDRRFFDKRSEIWWTMAQEIKGHAGQPGVALPESPELVTDLTGPEMTFDNKGKIRLESKDSMKKRGLKSPDLGDALAMTYSEQMFSIVDLPSHAQRVLGNGKIKTEYDIFSGLAGEDEYNMGDI